LRHVVQNIISKKTTKKGENEMEHEHYQHQGGGGEQTPLVGNTPHSRNDHYHVKAINAIRARGDKLGIHDIADSEDEMKQLLSLLLGVDDDHAEIIYEIMERVVSCHWKKINRA
jgi:hypothetical protein